MEDFPFLRIWSNSNPGKAKTWEELYDHSEHKKCGKGELKDKSAFYMFSPPQVKENMNVTYAVKYPINSRKV